MNQIEKSELLRGRVLRRLLIANRGEIAVRIARAASDAGIETVAIFSEEDSNSLHTRLADRAVPLKAAGARAYLDIDRIVSIASELGFCDSIHPGYGFPQRKRQFRLALHRDRPQLRRTYSQSSLHCSATKRRRAISLTPWAFPCCRGQPVRQRWRRRDLSSNRQVPAAASC